MRSNATTIEQYLAELPEDRREAIEAVRNTILENLPEGYEEVLQGGAIGYVVPHSVYPPGYHCNPTDPLPFAGLASQKRHMGIYLMCIYNDEKHETWFREAWLKTGKKLDMGKSCVRFRKLDDVPLKVVGQAIKRVPVKKFIKHYESALEEAARNRASKAAKKKTTAAKAAASKKSGSRKENATKKSSPARRTAKKKTAR